VITIKNRQRTVVLDIESIRADVAKILSVLDYNDFDIGIAFVNLNAMRAYNYQYRRQDKATDILSFPLHADLKAGRRIVVTYPEDKNLGDLIIAPLYVRNDLERWQQTFEQRMKVLLVHGICHLLGYDHIQDADYRVMKKKEAELLALL
jgi:probable rRNA maturation factor